jgi:archaellum component FlaG (FlaF/FlaG flagellin family)
MKKALSVLVLFMAVLVVSAQTTTTTTNAKQSKVSVKVTELQKSITDNVAKDFPGFTIKEAFSVTKGNDVTYEVVIVKGTVVETLVYDKEGKFVKKLAPPALPKQ